MMYLLDTCVLIWLLSAPTQLSDKARLAITSSKAAYISFASLWEISIKQSNGKLNLQKTIQEIAQTCESANIRILYPTPEELDNIQKLPKIHGDPFDRLIISQARTRNMTIITSDNYIPQYEVSVLW